MNILLRTKLVKDVKQTRYSVCDAFIAPKIAVKPGYPCWMSNKSTWFKGKCRLVYSCFGNCRRLAYKSSAYEVCIICPKLVAACKIHCKSPSRRLDGLTTLDWFTVHEATLSAYIRESAHLRSHVGRRKSDANKQDFEIKLNFKFDLSSPIHPQNNSDLNQGILHLWPKFGDPSLNRWWVIAQTNSKWGKFWL